MQDINIDDLANVTGGAGLLQNMGTGAQNRGNRWANNTADFFGRESVLGGIGGAFAGLFGSISGGLQGFGHTMTTRIRMPEK